MRRFRQISDSPVFFWLLFLLHTTGFGEYYFTSYIVRHAWFHRLVSTILIFRKWLVSLLYSLSELYTVTGHDFLCARLDLSNIYVKSNRVWILSWCTDLLNPFWEALELREINYDIFAPSPRPFGFFWELKLKYFPVISCLVCNILLS